MQEYPTTDGDPNVEFDVPLDPHTHRDNFEVGMSPTRDYSPLAELFGAFLLTFSPRTIAVLRERTFADQPITLARIADELGVSRERVRQIEVRGILQLHELASNDELARHASARLRTMSSPVRALGVLLDNLPGISCPIMALGIPTWRVLEVLDGSFQILDGWAATPNVSSARLRTVDALKAHADEFGLADISVLADELPDGANDQFDVVAWLEYCKVSLISGHAYVGGNSKEDRSVAALNMIGVGATAEEIYERIGSTGSIRSLRNVLSSDPRIVRTDKNRWGLLTWGAQTYLSVRDLIGRAIDDSGGSISLRRLTESITSNYSITSSTVVTFASSRPFQNSRGRVSRSPVAKTTRKSPFDTKRMYRRDGDWLFRLTVTSEHLRGSGTVVPVALASILNLSFGQSTSMESATGPQRVSWTGPQVTIGSVRSLLAAHDIQLGQQIFLVFGHGGVFSVDAVALDRSSSNLEKAMALVGVSSAKVQPWRALAECIGIPSDSDPEIITWAFTERGDSDVASLLAST